MKGIEYTQSHDTTPNLHSVLLQTQLMIEALFLLPSTPTYPLFFQTINHNQYQHQKKFERL
jgi:hypothetical protein